MKLEMPEVKVVMGDGNIPMQEFGIGNLGVIMETLRSKIYSNPRKIVLQEIACNARDANREVGKANIPIRIKLPTKHEPELHISDEGPGIDPVRMNEIYLLLGNSTKRDSQEQTGCFGLGSKTPFAYGNSFGIETVAKESDGKLRKRDYIAVVDESRKGKLMLVNTQDSDGPTGTTIKVPIKPDDCQIFKEYAADIFKYWGANVTFNMTDVFNPDDYKPFMEGSDWKLFLQHNKYGVFYYEDGIPYPIESKNLQLPNRKMNVFFNEVRLEIFGKGAIQVTATRESIDYQTSVQAFIINRLAKVYEEINANISGRVEQCGSYWEALILVNENKQKLEGLLDNVHWKGNKVVVGSISFENASIHFLEKTGYEDKVKCRTRNWGFTPSASNMVFFNDYKSGRPNYLLVPAIYKYAEKEFERLGVKDRSTSVYVISWKRSDDPVLAKKIEDEKAKICFDSWNLKPISDFRVFAKKGPSGDGGPRQPVCRARMFCGDNRKYEQSWERTDLDLDADSGVYVLLHERSPIGYTLCDLDTIKAKMNIDIYGIPTRFAEKLGPNWTPLKDELENFFDAEVSKLPSFPEICSSEFLVDKIWKSEVVNVLKKAKVNGKIGHYLHLSDEFETNKEKIFFLKRLSEIVGKPLPPTNNVLQKACKDAIDAFPMLTFLESNYFWEDRDTKLGISYKDTILTYISEIEARLNADDAEKKAAADKAKQEAPKPVVTAEPAPDKTEVLALPSSEFGIMRQN